ncbi:hypothetical protein OG342_22110 [Streptomyces bobili]|uniref:hypothetical protein n=1 Tax=Streptomyces bobili TaxID=67280 RepID=UPI002250A36D|nr:hypothetical protein [Streptomyces bobili]MCX5525514.1 hypothetical protein [Streptomyces bobili]
MDRQTQDPREVIAGLLSRLHTMRARAMAAAGQHTAAHRALDQDHRDLNASADTAHPWLSPFDAGRLASEEALILVDLGEYDEALAAAEEAVTLRDAGRARSLALARITLADIHVRRGDLDAALAVGHDLLATSPTLGSIRVVQQLDDLRALLESHKGHEPVREYLVRFGDTRRARMLLLADLIPSPGGPRR